MALHPKFLHKSFRIAFEDVRLCFCDNFGVLTVVETAFARTVIAAGLASGEALTVHF